MAFNFGSSVPVDQVNYGDAIQAPAPALALNATTPQAVQALSAPAPQAPAQAPAMPDIQVSPGEAFVSMLIHGGTPQEAAMRVRSDKLQNMMTQMELGRAQQAYQAMSRLPQAQQLAIFLNGPKAGDYLGEREFKPIVANPGQTVINGPGGQSAFAPQTGMTDAGIPYVIDQHGFRTLAPQLPGKKTAENGVVLDNNLGLTGQRYAIPETVGPGQVLKPFLPGFSGPGAQPGPGTPPASGISGGSAPAGNPNAAGPIPKASALLNANGQLDPHAFFTDFWLPQEGGLNPADGNGAPTNMGINQTANPQVNVKTLTPPQAEQLFTQKYFGPSGAANLPPALALVHADTYGINPKMAGIFLQESKGDPNQYIAMRQQWMDNEIQAHPQLAKYAQPWANRNAALGALVSQFGGSQTGNAVQPTGGSSQPGGVPTEIGEGVSGPPAYKALIDPKERAAAGINPNDHGSYILTPEGPKQIAADPYGSEWAKGTRQQFMESDGYKQLIPAQSAVQALEHNIGQMTGPAAYTLLDTMARTINPGAVARSGTIQAIEEHFGIPAHITGTLQNFAGKGSIPLNVQQEILNAVIPFAQSHWDQAKAAYDANVSLGAHHGVPAEDVTAPIGDRPLPMIVGPVPAPAQRKANTIYQTPKGLGIYLGNGRWQPLQ